MLVLWPHAATSGPEPRNDHSQSYCRISRQQQGQHPPGTHTCKRRSSPWHLSSISSYRLLASIYSFISCLWTYQLLSACCGHGNFYPFTMNHSFVSFFSFFPCSFCQALSLKPLLSRAPGRKYRIVGGFNGKSTILCFFIKKTSNVLIFYDVIVIFLYENTLY